MMTTDRDTAGRRNISMGPDTKLPATKPNEIDERFLCAGVCVFVCVCFCVCWVCDDAVAVCHSVLSQ
jgi:hypothetical protein